jgi:putative membrane protein
MGYLVRLIISAVAVWLSAVIVPGVDVTGPRSGQIATLLVVALVFGIVNSVLKPIVKVLAFPLYILTLGLFAFVANGLLFWLASWITDKFPLLDGRFVVSGFWAAVFGAIVVAVASWLIGVIVPDSLDHPERGRARRAERDGY